MLNRFNPDSTANVLTKDRLQMVVPSVYTTGKKSTLSDRYNFIPTYEVVNELEKQGWLPVKAGEMKCRDHGNREYTKHMIRFQNFDERVRPSLYLYDAKRNVEACVEMILINSHNGCSAYQFKAGIFRFVCFNGLIIAESLFGEINIRHSSYEARNIIDVCSQITTKTPEIASNVSDFQKIELTPEEKIVYAESAKILRFDNPASVSNSEILRPRRYEDHKDDLWTVFNVTQENLTKGHIRQNSQDQYGRATTRKTKEVKAIDKNVKINQALWTLTQKMAEIKIQYNPII